MGRQLHFAASGSPVQSHHHKGWEKKGSGMWEKGASRLRRSRGALGSESNVQLLIFFAPSADTGKVKPIIMFAHSQSRTQDNSFSHNKCSRQVDHPGPKDPFPNLFPENTNQNLSRSSRLMISGDGKLHTTPRTMKSRLR